MLVSYFGKLDGWIGWWWWWRSPCWEGRGLGRGCSTFLASLSCCPQGCELQTNDVDHETGNHSVTWSSNGWQSGRVVSKGGDKGAPISSLPPLCRIFHRFVVPPALLTNDPPWYLCCVAKLLENICAESFHCHRFQRPALARDEKTLKCTVEFGRARKLTILFLTSLIGPFGFSAVFSLAFNHTVYNCAEPRRKFPVLVVCHQ